MLLHTNPSPVINYNQWSYVTMQVGTQIVINFDNFLFHFSIV
jgi:hypothetical protein